MEKLDGKSLDLVKTNIEALKQLFPEVVTEGKIDFDKLKLVLGEEIETRNEKYEFTWHGKTQAMKLAQTPSTGTLRPDKASSKNWETTENLYIEGDNLEVLKLLQKSYFGKIKMIYIDPPYNTGKDFVYKDDFRDNIRNYKEITQQTTKANTETNGRYHTDWLNMMYPRLKLARNLLREDGVIFISIDDTEVSNLKKICDEIFGEVNFITIFIWQRAFAPVNMNKFASRNHDFVLCYAKQTDFLSWYGLPRSQEADTRYSNPDNDPRGPWTSGDLSVGPPVPEKIYEIVTPSGRVVYPPKGYCWRVTKERFAELLADNRIWFGKDGDSVPRLKRFLSEVKSTITPLTVWTHQEVSHSQDAKKELKELFEDQSVMDYPKPVKLMKRILELSTRENDIILDFFSGSATTAHAVMQLNAEDGGNRKFIMVQLPEKTDETSDAYKAGYKNICEIGKERIRRAGEKIVQETGKTDLDIGFKVFKLDSSNIKEWDPDFENLERDLFDLQNNIKEDRTKEDLLYEILLKIGLPLTVPIEEIDCRGKTIYNVAYGSVLICLEDEIDLDLVQEMLKHRSEHMPPKVILKESGFMSDAVKTNALQTLKKHGITDVRSV
ncbi:MULTISPECIES: site-specific DNA-methyltransferase [Geobacillus]|uniref:site-specific DNA-methyltransferase n=1 Tax=Geobacillus TaxID=129337 RepID=UPI000764322D|nr:MULTISPECIES: site-specific DNA-methyltransferase [Geobacillus]OQP17438.1 site-specific DNA-methyltransferase [Geobacillus zalihae]RXS87027.1 site-specific DNA-methyltransferase [Geobacillus sp. PK12]